MPAQPTALPETERITAEMVVGAFPFAEIQSTAAVQLPSRTTLLRGTSLVVARPGGERVQDGALVPQIAAELARTFGGWFERDLAGWIALYDRLLSRALEQHYTGGGMRITIDTPERAFYDLSFAVPPWQVQAVGEPDVLHAVFLAHPLSRAEALAASGQPNRRPLGEIMAVLREAAPTIAAQPLVDQTDRHASNVFDTYLTNETTVIKAGVRMLALAEGDQASAAPPFFYGVRINVTPPAAG